MCCKQQRACSIISAHNHVPFLVKWTYYAIFPLMWCDLFFPYFLNVFINDLLQLFPSLLNQFGWDLIMSSCFSIFQLTYCHLFVYVTWWINKWFCSLYAHCPHFFTVTVCSILQFVCTLSTRLLCHCLFHLAVCTHIVHTSSLSLSVPSCSCTHIIHTSSLSSSVPSCSLYAHCPHVFTVIVCSILQLYAHCPHFFTVIVCSILQFVRTFSTLLQTTYLLFTV